VPIRQSSSNSSDTACKIQAGEALAMLDLGLASLEPGAPPAPMPENPGIQPDIGEIAALLPDLHDWELLGEGGMGIVFSAWDPRLGRSVAVKMLRHVGLEQQARFRREAMLLGSLQHPNIVGVHGFHETPDGQMLLVMEHVKGQSLAAALKEGLPTVEQAVAWLSQVAEALQAAHAQGIIHRDVKPSNILLDQLRVAKLADFGLARVDTAAAVALTRGSAQVGTFDYAAPEQLSGSQVTAAADVYSLGVVAYEILAGARPRGVFPGPSAVRPGLDAAFDAPVLTALQSSPARRWASSQEFIQALHQAADKRWTRAEAERKLRAKYARRAKWGLAGFIAAITFGALAVWGWTQQQKAQANRQDAEKLVDYWINEAIWLFQEPELLKRWEPMFQKLENYYAEWGQQRSDPAFYQSYATFMQVRAIWNDRQNKAAEAERDFLKLATLRDHYLTLQGMNHDQGSANALWARLLLAEFYTRAAREQDAARTLQNARHSLDAARAARAMGNGMRQMECHLMRLEADYKTAPANIHHLQAACRAADELLAKAPDNLAVAIEKFKILTALLHTQTKTAEFGAARETAQQLTKVFEKFAAQSSLTASFEIKAHQAAAEFARAAKDAELEAWHRSQIPLLLARLQAAPGNEYHIQKAEAWLQTNAR
jgi:serine/threonine protein kinase